MRWFSTAQKESSNEMNSLSAEVRNTLFSFNSLLTNCIFYECTQHDDDDDDDDDDDADADAADAARQNESAQMLANTLSLGVYPLAYVWALLFIFRPDACWREKIVHFFVHLSGLKGWLIQKACRFPPFNDIAKPFKARAPESKQRPCCLIITAVLHNFQNTPRGTMMRPCWKQEKINWKKKHNVVKDQNEK